MEQGQPHDELLLEDETAPAIEQPGETETTPALPADDPAFPASPPAPSRRASMVRGAVRMLLAFAFSQYVIVTVMVAAGAIFLSKTVSGLLVEKFDAIARALRHF
ncbi:hypothetical protein AFIC_001415 [[Pseudomonas] carboxydohydrogena]|uniref:Uncharacterized protein n=1 Tax=Afipia carboxydohydrogena TaxID=290 RepID=A0ABY8BW97_AFICR|nr:hypothetical protein [[Pseudomonas] carboxydohydrogena]WEF52905.1 hypothetical protein AFIC_001415 [[Pseudomonas] carboxydohydrogena]